MNATAPAACGRSITVRHLCAHTGRCGGATDYHSGGEQQICRTLRIFSCGSVVVTGADDAVRSPSPAYKLRAVSLALMQPTKSNTLAVRPETVTHPASSVMSWKIFDVISAVV